LRNSQRNPGNSPVAPVPFTFDALREKLCAVFLNHSDIRLFVMAPDYIADHDGLVRAINSPRIRADLGSSLPVEDLADFAVRNLGYIGLRASPRSVRIWMRPKSVKPKSLLGAMQWLEGQAGKRVVLSCYEERWNDRVFGDSISAIQGIVNEVLPANPRSRDFVRKDRVNPEYCPEGLQVLLALWRASPQRYDEATLFPILKQWLHDRYIVVRVNEGRHLVHDAGSGMPMLSPAWRRVSVGQRFEDLHDYEFGRWSVQAYQRAAEQAAPVLEDLDVIINLPGRPRTRVTYTRVILPFETDKGSRLLLGASLIDPNVNLRRAVGQEAG
jgi:hypothetical protein